MIDIREMKVEEIKKYVSNIIKEDNQSFDYDLLCDTLKNDTRKTVKKLSDNVYRILLNRENEIERVKKLYDFDRKLKFKYIAGVDEVGRGPLAGPIVAASVVLNLDFENDNELILKINDSKKLNAKTREELSSIIMEKAVSYAIVEINNSEIDKKGIAWCNNEVLKQSVYKLDITPSLALSDGYLIKNCNINNKFVVKGDSKSASIACASIIAKVYRDNLMRNYASNYPEYGFDRHVGYGTKEHIEAIKKYGPTSIHRMSFLKNIINLF